MRLPWGKPEPEPVNPLKELTPQEQAVLRKYAAKASYFRGSLPVSLSKDAGLITAHFLAGLLHEDYLTQRQGAVKILGGVVKIEPRGTTHGGVKMITLKSGEQARINLKGADLDGVEVPIEGLTAETNDTTGTITAEIQARSDGTSDLVVADTESGQTTDPLNPPTVTAKVADPSVVPFVETVAVVAAGVSSIAAGEATIEPRGTPAP